MQNNNKGVDSSGFKLLRDFRNNLFLQTN